MFSDIEVLPYTKKNLEWPFSSREQFQIRKYTHSFRILGLLINGLLSLECSWPFHFGLYSPLSHHLFRLRERFCCLSERGSLFLHHSRCPSPKRALAILSESSVTETVHYSPTTDSELADRIAKAGREVKKQTSYESQPPQAWLEGIQSQWEETRLPVLTPSSWFRAHSPFFGLNKAHTPILPRAPKTFLGPGPGHGPTAQELGSDFCQVT